MKDKRFTITREYCGYPKPRHVLRFCGDYLDNYPSRKKAVAGRRKAIADWNAKLDEECRQILAS